MISFEIERCERDRLRVKMNGYVFVCVCACAVRLQTAKCKADDFSLNVFHLDDIPVISFPPPSFQLSALNTIFML